METSEKTRIERLKNLLKNASVKGFWGGFVNGHFAATFVFKDGKKEFITDTTKDRWASELIHIALTLFIHRNTLTNK